MDFDIVFRLLVLIGLAFNIVGTFLIVFSIKFPGLFPVTVGQERETDSGEEVVKYSRIDLPKFEKCMLRCGVSILATGFIFQFAGMLLELILN